MVFDELKLHDVVARFVKGKRQQMMVNGLTNDTVYFENYPKPFKLFSQSKENFNKSKWSWMGNIKPKG